MGDVTGVGSPYTPPPTISMGDTGYSTDIDARGIGDTARFQYSATEFAGTQLDLKARNQELKQNQMYAELNANMANSNNAFGQTAALHEMELRDRAMGLQEKTLGIQGDHVSKSDLHFETARDADNTLTAMMNDIRADKSLSAEEKTKAIGELYSTQRQSDAANMHYSNQTTIAGTSNNTATSQSSGMIGQNSQGANAMLMGQGNQSTGIGMGTAGFTQGFDISGNGGGMGGMGMMPPMPMGGGMFSSPMDTTFGLLGGTGMPATGAPSALSSVPSGNINKGG